MVLRGSLRSLRPRAWLATAALPLVLACGETTESGGPPGAVTAAPSASVVADPTDGVVLPPPRFHDSNPLGLPPATPVATAKGQRIFAPDRRMLDGAKLGSALMLEAGTVVGHEGAELVVRVGNGEPFQIHPGYVVVPKPGRFQRGAAVIASYNGRLHHGLVTSLRRDRVVVQFTDLGRKLGEQHLAHDRVGVLEGGLAPGAFAVYRADQEYRHVLLVSSGAHADGKIRWLVLEHTGESRLLEQEQLTRLPEQRFKAKEDDEVFVAFRGSMVRAMVRSFERPGLYTVKRPRAGAPLVVGADMLMRPP
ncbi:MAG: hypothetical protein R3B72_14675 [Polyangiaceae bacterium]